MIIDITNRCYMNCSHCMNNSSHDGEHMSRETFIQALDLADELNPFMVMIGGGECTEHPEFFEFIDIFKKRGYKIKGIGSNGMYQLRPNAKEFSDRLYSLGIRIQIANDPKYYPIRIDNPNHPLVDFFDHIPNPDLIPVGRAKGMETKRRGSPCFNIRSLNRSMGGNLMLSILKLAMMGKMCPPVVRVDGTITPGESSECGSIGTVWDSPETLSKNLLLDFNCNKCGLNNKLPLEYRRAIGGVEND